MIAKDFLWPPAPAGWRPSKESIHVFAAPLDVPRARLEELGQSLSEDERARAGHFHLDRDRNRYLAGRGTLREILGTLLGINPREFVFSYGEFGKPQIASPLNEFHFNVAHSDSIAVYAVADSQIGVDIERSRLMDHAEQIVSRFFSAREESCWLGLPLAQRAEAFFNCWTRKEAYLKAIGSGLDNCLNQIEVSLLPHEPPQLFSAPAEARSSEWFLHALSPVPEFTGAVAIRKKDARVNCWTWAQ